jgi:hypothetical protein
MRPLKLQFSFWRHLTFHALWLHASWEAVQCRLFYDMSGLPTASTFVSMVGSAVADVALTLVLVVVTICETQRRHGGITGRTIMTGRSMAMLSACGALSAVLVELVALRFGWWRYSPRMPVISLFGWDIGVLPVLQMALLPLVSLLLARLSLSFKRK